jgi:molecular chaperone GrpE
MDRPTVPNTEGSDADDGRKAADLSTTDLEGGTVETLRNQLAEAEDRWRRAMADIDNLRKRFARDGDRARREERARVAAMWLPVLDHLELALEHAYSDPAAIVDGVKAVRDQAVELLERLGFARQGQEGEQFDATRHEAVSTVADPTRAPGTIVQVVRPGYGDGDDQLRPAAVVVSTSPT